MKPEFTKMVLENRKERVVILLSERNKAVTEISI